MQSVCERTCSSVMLLYVTGSGGGDAGDKHLPMLETTTGDVFTFDENE